MGLQNRIATTFSPLKKYIPCYDPLKYVITSSSRTLSNKELIFNIELDEIAVRAWALFNVCLYIKLKLL